MVTQPTSRTWPKRFLPFPAEGRAGSQDDAIGRPFALAIPVILRPRLLMQSKLLTLALALTVALTSASAQISGTINANSIYEQRVYLNGNLTINGSAQFVNGLEVASGTNAASLTVNGDTNIQKLAGTTTSPLRNVTITGQLGLNGPVICVDTFRVVGPLVCGRDATKITAGSINISGNLTLENEQTLILETNGGDITIGGNLVGPTNPNVSATLIISARNGGTFRFTGTRDARVRLSLSSGSSVGAPMYPIALSTRTELSSGSGPFIVGLAVSNPDGGAGSVSSRFLVRAIGPGLNQFGLKGAEDPKLQVSGSVRALVDDWSSDATNRTAVQDAMPKAGAFPIDVGSKDAAIVIDAPPGALTVVVGLASGQGGAVLVEIYRVP